MSKEQNLYSRLIQHIFDRKFVAGSNEVKFDREDLQKSARVLGIRLPKNLGDVIYSFRYREQLPEGIEKKAPRGKKWAIRPRGKGRYAFVAAEPLDLRPKAGMLQTKIPDSTPGVIARYVLSDEQAALARIRYNRLLDIFTGITCYSLQNHLRTSVEGMGQIETDEIYVGLDRQGVHYVLPVQAKGGRDRLGEIQIDQDVAMCREKFPNLVCRPIAAQTMPGGVIAMFEFGSYEGKLQMVMERHYRLVPPEDMTDGDLAEYRRTLGRHA